MQPDPTPPIQPGQVLDGKYRVGRVLGSGGMGLVFEGVHLLLDKRVALKVLRPEVSVDAEYRSRFEAEARAAAAIGHPNIVSVTDMGRTEAGVLYFVMDRLEGESLGDRIEHQKRLDVAAVGAVALDVLAGLEAAHALGLIHRDLKPDNVFLARSADGRETAKILDFGIAKALAEVGRRTIDDDLDEGFDEGAATLAQTHINPSRAAAIGPRAPRSSGRRRAMGTAVGVLLGTPEFMAPEQARAEGDIDFRVDLYAVGVIMYAALSGRAPFVGPTPMAVIAGVMAGNPVPLPDLCPGVPDALASLIASAMSRSRELRPSSAREFRERLQAALAAPRPSAARAIGMGMGSPAPSLVTLGSRAVGPSHISLARPVESLPASMFEAPAPHGPPGFGGGGPAARWSNAPAADLELAAPVLRRQGRVAPQKTWTGWGPMGRRAGWIALAAALWFLGPAVLRSALRLLDGTLEVIETKVPHAREEAAAPQVRIYFDVSPRGSKLFVDGVSIPSNPVYLRKSSALHRVAATSDGYAPALDDFVADDHKTVTLRLEPTAGAQATPRRRRP